MKIPLQIIVHETDRSEAVEAKIREKAAKLDRFSGDIMSCHVIVEAPQHRRHKGKLYNVRIDLSVPDDEIVVTHQPSEDIFVSIRDAFDAAVRQLEDYQRRRRGEIKHHESPPEGEVTRLFPDEGYGFLKTPTGSEIYFHRNAVQGACLADLRVGAKVRFSEEMGEKGPQATVVRPFGA